MSVLALSGGIGGAKLALGLYRTLPPGALIVVANTGDDFEHLGLSISPDIDTLLYTLGGIDNPETGWGRKNETWTFMAAVETLGGETWFKLGDGDLATHVERTRRLAAGESLSQITDDFRGRFGISARLLPMSDDRVRTRLRTEEEGWLDFQDYFVRLRAEPVVREILYAGASEARANPDLLAALVDDSLEAVVICPSNPFLSIDPVLSLPGVRAALRRCRAPVVAVSPIIGGRAVKGPTAKIMAELGLSTSAAAVARHYEDILDVFVADEADEDDVAGLGIPVTLTRTLMVTLEARDALARAVMIAVGRGS
jgi:LPPG:FO 2-phospho-L-lactate transferase